MHEMGIAMQIIDRATEALPADMKNKAVKKIHLKVGQLAAIIPASLRHCFEMINKGTPFEGSSLKIAEIPAVVRCRKCQAEWAVSALESSCKKCKNEGIDIISGQELNIDSLEIRVVKV